MGVQSPARLRIFVRDAYCGWIFCDRVLGYIGADRVGSASRHEPYFDSSRLDGLSKWVSDAEFIDLEL